MSSLSAVILDVDGTLLDSNEAHAAAFLDAARSLGIPGPGFDDLLRMIGMGGDKLIPKAFGFEADSDPGGTLDRVKGEIFRNRYAPTLEPTPGARELLIRLRGDDLRLVVATSANGDDLQLLLDRAGVDDLVERCTTSSDVDESKPEPDVVHAALEQAGAAPREAVMIGDTPYDVEAALRAGVRILAVRCGGWADADLQGATAVYDDPADLLRRYHSSIFR
jgi:HAD superfamily hydrolase (TIGR01509 family)